MYALTSIFINLICANGQQLSCQTFGIMWRYYEDQFSLFGQKCDNCEGCGIKTSEHSSVEMLQWYISGVHLAGKEGKVNLEDTIEPEENKLV